ncbi:MAG: hypothetical protein LBM71_00660 [Elusimicrobiota bacterium]|jgi:SpoIID/LytB domain protein|nr:hypothetical protein [Elusimicrobiota bacterium]
MKIYKYKHFVLPIFISALFCALFCAPLLAQSLAELTGGKTTLAGNSPALEQEKIEAAKAEEAKQAKDSSGATASLSVSRLPDIKLNENIITRSVMNYSVQSGVLAADKTYQTGGVSTALAEYEKEAAAATDSSAYAAAQAALLHLQNGDYKKALTFAKEATEIEEHNPFYQLVKVWVLSASGNYKQAAKEYENLLFLTADFEYISAAKLALISAYFHAKKTAEAMSLLQNIYANDPYVISYAAYLMARINFAGGDYQVAQTLFEQALNHDNNNYMALKYLAQAQQKLKEYVSAWQSNASLFILDTKDSKIAKNLKTMTKFLTAKPIDYLFYTRLDEIYTKKPDELGGEPVRIGLFSDYNGNLTQIESFNFLPGSSFSIEDERLGKVISGEAFTPKTIVFDKEHQGVHIQNKWNNSDFSTKRPFFIKLDKPGYTFLVKDVKAQNIFASNLGDKELEGSLLVIPHEDGMTVVNYTTLEEMLPSALMSLSRGVKTPAALEALAIALRTRLVAELANTKGFIYDVPDNAPNLQYGGVNMESEPVKNAAINTVNTALTAEQGGLKVLSAPQIYRSCSVISEDGVRNTAEKIDYSFSPANLFKYMISNPPKDLISAPQDPTLWAPVKWIYSMPKTEIEARLKQKHKIGSLKNIEPAEFSPSGRVLKVRFVGSKTSVALPFKEANFILAAGTLRSNFFFFIPFNNKKEYLFIGTDSGLGEGLCIDGANGMAEAGKTRNEILKYYYPNLEISKEWLQKKLPS